MQIYVHGIFGKNNIKIHHLIIHQGRGLSDEYYSKCQSGNEKIYTHGIISTSIIDSISSALDDSQRTGQYYNRGHRYNLLNPEWKYIESKYVATSMS